MPEPMLQDDGNDEDMPVDAANALQWTANLVQTVEK